MMTYEELQEFEKQNKELSKKLLFTASVIGATTTGVVIVLAPSMPQYSLFFGLTLGAFAGYMSYTQMVATKKLEMMIDKIKNGKQNESKK
jgi:hypothetical protein